jgi:His/Glu/Gln/Arg/opine family amino acid ABC transporter permease subunit
VLLEFLPAIGQGLATTVAVAAASILGCALVSIALGVARRSTLVPVKAGAGFIVELLRGASVLIYLFWVYYALPLLPGMPRLSPIAVSIVVLSLVGGAYGAEIVVSGLQAVPKGQAEAAQALGLSKYRTFATVVLPQALTQIVPAFASLAIDMVKWTAIVSFLGVQDLLAVANNIRTITYSTVGVYVGVALIYLGLCLCTSHLFRLLEQALPLNRALNAGRSNGRSGPTTTLVMKSQVPQP